MGPSQLALTDGPHPATEHHPAQFSAAILDACAPALRRWGLPVHDPFAGTGVKLGALCDRLGLAFTGAEIEPEFIADRRVHPGDSTQAVSYPPPPFAVVTSPTYGNGMNDHFRASDGSKRMNYRFALARLLGFDRPLHRNNTGQYGIRRGRRAMARYWELNRLAAAHWPDHAIVNAKDFVVRRELYPLVAKWVRLLEDHGYDVVDRIDVDAPGNRFGENSAARVDQEAVVVCERAP